MTGVTRSLPAAIGSLLVLLAAASAAGAGPAAPGFRVRLLDSRAVFDSREEIGKHPIVVRFQSTWCKVCVRQSPAFATLVDQYRDRGVRFIALQVEDTAPDVRSFVRAHHVAYPIALDPRLTIGNRFGFKGTPYTVVIDRRGEIVARLHGESAITRLPKILDDVTSPGRRR